MPAGVSFEGTITGSAISPRDVMKSTLGNNAVSLVFAHNHPSDNPEPSQNDKHITRDLVYGGYYAGKDAGPYNHR